MVYVEGSADLPDGYYFCDNIGWTAVSEFDESKAVRQERKENKIEVIICRPGRVATVETIDNALEAKQEIVGGYIQAVYPFEDNIAILCDDEGKLKGYEPCRALLDENRSVVDIFCGTIILVGLNDLLGEFSSIPEDLKEKYFKMFERPELFARGVNGKIYVKKL